jgi:hypothetical protein
MSWSLISISSQIIRQSNSDEWGALRLKMKQGPVFHFGGPSTGGCIPSHKIELLEGNNGAQILHRGPCEGGDPNPDNAWVNRADMNPKRNLIDK